MQTENKGVEKGGRVEDVLVQDCLDNETDSLPYCSCVLTRVMVSVTLLFLSWFDLEITASASLYSNKSKKKLFKGKTCLTKRLLKY